jgi:hypothetical protein
VKRVVMFVTDTTHPLQRLWFTDPSRRRLAIQ